MTEYLKHASVGVSMQQAEFEDIDSHLIDTLPFSPGTLSGSAYVIASDAPATALVYGAILYAAGYPVWVCNADHDEIEIQAAIDSLSASLGGLVQFSVGTFYSGKVLVNKNKTLLQGQGLGTKLYLTDGTNDHLLYVTGTNCQLGQMTLDCDRTQQTTGSMVFGNGAIGFRARKVEILEGKHRAIYLTNCQNSYLDDITAAESPGFGLSVIELDGTSHDSNLSHLDIGGGGQDSAAHGLYFHNVLHCSVDNLQSFNNHGEGLALVGANATRGSNIRCEKNDLNGIYFGSTKCVFTNVYCYNNSKSPTNTWSGIYLDSTAAGNKITGGMSTDEEAVAKTQKYGLEEQAGADENTIVNLDVDGNATDTIILTGANSRAYACHGYNEDKHGLASNVTLDGSGVGAIAHGANVTPDYANVICASDNLSVKVTSIDATNINILVKDLAGNVVTVDTHDFYWEVKK